MAECYRKDATFYENNFSRECKNQVNTRRNSVSMKIAKAIFIGEASVGKTSLGKCSIYNSIKSLIRIDHVIVKLCDILTMHSIWIIKQQLELILKLKNILFFKFHLLYKCGIQEWLFHTSSPLSTDRKYSFVWPEVKYIQYSWFWTISMYSISILSWSEYCLYLLRISKNNNTTSRKKVVRSSNCWKS